VKPYKEHKISESVIIRTFSVNIPEEELQWHWDEEDRLVEALNKNDWQFQFDNQLPIPFEKMINIPAGEIHRVIKGTVPLIVKITKKNETYTNI
jgi:hypothetical protein